MQPLELLGADDVAADDLHGLDDLVVAKLSDGLGALLVMLFGSLDRDELVAVLGDDGGDLTTWGEKSQARDHAAAEAIFCLTNADVLTQLQQAAQDHDAQNV